MIKTILVTGGAGYIGSACVAELIKNDHKVVVFDNFSTGQPDKVDAKAEKISGDLINYHDILAACSTHQFDTVIHFAAKKAVGESEMNPSLYFENNVVGSFNLLKAMEHQRIKDIVFSSTATLYQPANILSGFKETDKTAPANTYGITKKIVEDMIIKYHQAGQINKYSIFRYFNVAGDAGLSFVEKNSQNVFPVIGQCLKEGKTFSVFGTDYQTKDGTCVRDYVHLKDLAGAHLSALNTDKSNVYNLGTGVGYTVLDLVEAFNKLTSKKLIVNNSDRRPGDPAFLLADSTLANNELGWTPKFGLEDMVRDTLAVYQI